MMSRTNYALLVLAVVIYPIMGQADEFSPSNYDECITDSMKGVASDIAANAILTSCRNRFPEKEELAPTQTETAPTQEIIAPEQAAVAAGAGAVAVEQLEATPEAAPEATPEATPEKQEITSESSRSLTPEEMAKLRATAFMLGTSYKIRFKNGNEHLTITEVTIAVWDKSVPDELRTYDQNVRVPPLGENTAKYKVIYEGQDRDWAWKVASAKGTD